MEMCTFKIVLSNTPDRCSEMWCFTGSAVVVHLDSLVFVLLVWHQSGIYDGPQGLIFQNALSPLNLQNFSHSENKKYAKVAQLAGGMGTTCCHVQCSSSERLSVKTHTALFQFKRSSVVKSAKSECKGLQKSMWSTQNINMLIRGKPCPWKMLWTSQHKDINFTS
jgi:hypothetical protein